LFLPDRSVTASHDGTDTGFALYVQSQTDLWLHIRFSLCFCFNFLPKNFIFKLNLFGLADVLTNTGTVFFISNKNKNVKNTTVNKNTVSV
jgi:hypothetical protein